MVKHIVMWRLKENSCGNTKEENKKLIKEKLEALNGKIEGLLKIEVGFDFSNTESSFDICLYSEFESKQALDNYQAHPEHKAVMPFILEARTDRIVTDYEI
ncbi:MAG TPA: Dabb family protein [Spirochaetota bacterium]|nr:Dabb family protein [Spirochaetota bacterium]